MADQKPEDVKEVAKMFGGTMGDVGLACVLAFLILPAFAWLLGQTGLALPQMVQANGSIAIMLAVVFGSPISTIMTGGSRKVMLLKMAAGGLLGLFAFSLVDYFSQFAKKGEPLSFFWILLPTLLIMPIMFGAFAAKRFTENKGTPLSARSRDAIVEYLDTAGPLVMMAVLGITGAFYWLIQPSLQVTLAILAATLSAIIAWCLLQWNGEVAPIDEETTDLPRSTNIREALEKNLDVATQLLPAGVYMGGLMWLMLIAVKPSMEGFGSFVQDGEVDMWVLIQQLTVGGGIAMGVVIGGIMVAYTIAAVIFAVAAQTRGMGFGELEMRIKKFNEVLLFGAMARSFHGSMADRDKPAND